MKAKATLGTGFLMGTILFSGCGLPMLSDSHGGDHTSTSAHGHDLDDYGGSVNPSVSPTKAGLLARGMAIYKEVCTHCHQENGEGVPGFYPPLASADYLMADRKRPVGILLKGLKGEITVNGTLYNSEKPERCFHEIRGSDERRRCSGNERSHPRHRARGGILWT